MSNIPIQLFASVVNTLVTTVTNMSAIATAMQTTLAGHQQALEIVQQQCQLLQSSQPQASSSSPQPQASSSSSRPQPSSSSSQPQPSTSSSQSPPSTSSSQLQSSTSSSLATVGLASIPPTASVRGRVRRGHDPHRPLGPGNSQQIFLRHRTSEIARTQGLDRAAATAIARREWTAMSAADRVPWNRRYTLAMESYYPVVVNHYNHNPYGIARQASHPLEVANFLNKMAGAAERGRQLRHSLLALGQPLPAFIPGHPTTSLVGRQPQATPSTVAGQPTPVAGAQSQPTPTPVVAGQPTPTPVVAGQPTPTPVVAGQPTPTPVVAGQPTPTPVVAGQPPASRPALADHRAPPSPHSSSPEPEPSSEPARKRIKLNHSTYSASHTSDVDQLASDYDQLDSDDGAYEDHELI